PRYLNALNFCMLLPGPEAMQLAVYIGWLTHGVKGGIASGLLFVLPGAVVLVALSALYLFLGEVPVVAGLLFGLKAAVVALVLEALLRVAKRALKRWHHWVIAVAAFVALALFSVPFPFVVLAAGYFRRADSQRLERSRRCGRKWHAAGTGFSVSGHCGHRPCGLVCALGAALWPWRRAKRVHRSGAVFLADRSHHLWRRLCGARACRRCGGGHL
ncbi:MAG: chromate transporter, partial [Phyllobacteriaceae bacterium]|nr:chromate transporter [Phyllobacteriaceae bacterium]